MLYTNKSHKGGKIYRAGDYFCDAWRCTFLQISRGNVNMPQRFLSWLFLPQFVILPGFTKSRLVCLPDCMLSSPLYAKSQQSCPTLCDPVDRSPPGSSVPGILQARTLEWVAISFSNASKWKVKVKSLSRARLLATPWTAAYQAPLPMGFSRQEYWSGVPLPSPKTMLVVIQTLAVT